MNNNSSRSGLFLMELILSIFIFSVASAICIQLFIGSHTLSKKSITLNNAVTWCQNVAECFYATDGDLNEMVNLLNLDKNITSLANDEQLIIYFNGDNNPLTNDMDISSREYCLTATLCKDISNEYLLTLKITYDNINNNTENNIYSISPTLCKKQK